MPSTRSGTSKREITRLDYSAVNSQPQDNSTAVNQNTSEQQQQQQEQQQQQQQQQQQADIVIEGGHESGGGEVGKEGQKVGEDSVANRREAESTSAQEKAVVNQNVGTGRGSRKGCVKSSAIKQALTWKNQSSPSKSNDHMQDVVQEKVSWQHCFGVMVEQPRREIQCVLLGKSSVISGQMLGIQDEADVNFFKLEYPDGEKQAAQANGMEFCSRVRVNSFAMNQVRTVWLLGGEKIEIYDRYNRYAIRTFIYLPKFLHFLGVNEDDSQVGLDKDVVDGMEGIEEEQFVADPYDVMDDPFGDADYVEETEEEEDEEEEQEVEAATANLREVRHAQADQTEQADKGEQGCTDELDRLRAVQLGGVVLDANRTAESTDAIIVHDINQPVEESKDSKQSIKGPVTRLQAKKQKKSEDVSVVNNVNETLQEQISTPNKENDTGATPGQRQPLLSGQVANVQDILMQIPKEWSEKQDRMCDLLHSTWTYSPDSISTTFQNFPYYLSPTVRSNITELATLVLHHSHLLSTVPYELDSISNRVLLQGPYGSHVYQELLAKALAKEVGATLLVFDRKELRGEEVVVGQNKKGTLGGILCPDMDVLNMSDSQLRAFMKLINDLDLYGKFSHLQNAMADFGSGGTSGSRPRKKAKLSMYPNKLDSRSGDENRGKIGHSSPFIRDGDTVVFGVVGSGFAGESAKKRENLIKGKLDVIQNIFNQNFGQAATVARKAGLGSVLGPSADSGLTAAAKSKPSNKSSDHNSLQKSGPKEGQVGRVVLRFPGPPQRLGVWFTESVPGGHNLVGNGNQEGGNAEEVGLMENGYYCEGGELRVLADDIDGNLFGAAKQVARNLLQSGPVIVFIKDIDVVLGKSQERLEFLKSFLKQLPSQVLVLGSQILPADVKQKGNASGVDNHISKIIDQEVGNYFSLSGGGAFGSGSGAQRDVNKNPHSQLRELLPNVISIYAPVGEPHKSKWEADLQQDLANQREDRNRRNILKLLKRCNIECADPQNINIREQILDKDSLGQVVGWALANHVATYQELSTSNSRSDESKVKIKAENIMAGVERIKNYSMEQSQVRSQLRDVQTEDSYEKKILGEVIPPEAVGVSFEDVGALERVKECLREAVMLPLQRPELFQKSRLLQPPKGVLLFGPPGTGKTMLAKAVAKESGANFIHVSMSSIASKWFGDGEKYVRSLFSLARKILPCVIFVDEVDAMLGKRDRSSEHEAMRRIKNEFMQLWDGMRSMEGEQLLVLAATNRPMDLDEAVIRRLPRRLMVELPDKENRVKILEVILKGEDLAESFNYTELAEVTEGYSGSDMKNLCQAAAYRPLRDLLKQEQMADLQVEVERVGSKRKCSPNSTLRQLTIEDFKVSAKEVGPSVNNNDFLMNELKQWNEMYGEGGSRAPPVLTYFI